MILFCHRHNQPVRYIAACGICRHRRGCESYQRHLQPELPLVFRTAGREHPLLELETQDHVKRALDSLPAAEYRRLLAKALSLLPPDAREKRLIIRLKIFELLLAEREPAET